MSTIAQKIAKIIAKADGTTSETEAETFMAKAHALMEQHGLNMLDLGTLDSDDPLGMDKDAYISSETWKDKVAFHLARYYGCAIVMVPHKKRSTSYYLFGREGARVITTLMLPYVIKQIAAIGAAEYKAGRYPSVFKARTAVAVAMARRLMMLRAENEKKMRGNVGASGLNALVPVDLIEQMKMKAFPGGLSTSKVQMRTDQNAVRKAESISLNQQMKANAGVRRIGSR